jgi:hypothetical protein
VTPEQTYQPYYSAYLANTGKTHDPSRMHEYIAWIGGAWRTFRLTSALRHGTDAERQSFEEWLAALPSAAGMTV